MEPLRELNEGEKETTAKMSEDAARVAELFEKFSQKMHLSVEKDDVKIKNEEGE